MSSFFVMASIATLTLVGHVAPQPYITVEAEMRDGYILVTVIGDW